MNKKLSAKKIAISQLNKYFNKISKGANLRERVVITKHGDPLFEMIIRNIKSEKSKKKARYSLEDIDSLAFKTGDKNLSSNIDQILYE